MSSQQADRQVHVQTVLSKEELIYFDYLFSTARVIRTAMYGGLNVVGRKYRDSNIRGCMGLSAAASFFFKYSNMHCIIRERMYYIVVTVYEAISL
jgi:hypothetical protein